MDPRERINDPQESLRMAFDGRLAGLWTAMPCNLLSFDPIKLVASLQPSILGQFQNLAGEWNNVNLPVLINCPVIFPGGGGFSLTFPLAAGDDMLVIFASRCIDGWWQSGGWKSGKPTPQKQVELRMHDLSDGFCLPRVYSQTDLPHAVSTTTTQLRSDDGSMYVELAGSHVMNIVAPGGLNITAPTITMNASTKIELNTPDTQIDGNLTSGVGGGHTANFDGAIIATGEVTANGGHTVSAHIHGGVTTGGGSTATPTG